MKAILDSNAQIQNFDNIFRIPEGLRYIHTKEKEIRTNINTWSAAKSVTLNEVRINPNISKEKRTPLEESKKTSNVSIISKTSKEVRIDPTSNTAINRIINLSNTSNDQNKILPRRTSKEIRIDSNHILKTNPIKRPPIEVDRKSVV